MVKKIWTSDEDSILVERFHLTNDELCEILKSSVDTIKSRYKELGIDRPSGKNALSRARFAIFRERQRNSVPNDWFELPSTRTDAKAMDIPFYWTGTPCERALHISRRKTSSGGCWECDYGDHRLKLAVDPDYKDQRNLQKRNRYEANKDEYLEKQRDYKKRPESREWYREYEKQKRQTDINWRLAKSLRDRLYKAVTRDTKLLSAIKLVGCSITSLKDYLENQFTEGMSWENYGLWHIDHIRPCISFDLTDPEQQQECFHFRNLSPAWEYENKSKGGIWNDVDPRKKQRRSELTNE